MLAFAGGVTAAGVAAKISVDWYSTGPSLWIERVIRTHLHDVRLDSASLALFVKDSLQGNLFSRRRMRLTACIDYSIPMLSNHISVLRDKVHKLERLVLTDFLVGSNFFWITDSRLEPIIYTGPRPVCPNPFARFLPA